MERKNSLSEETKRVDPDFLRIDFCVYTITSVFELRVYAIRLI